MAGQLKGSVTAITGGGRGIGRAIAQRFAAEGASVVVAARTERQVAETVALINSAGGRARLRRVSADVTDQRAVERVVEQAEQQLGPIDVLVNNAGAVGTIGPIWEVDADEWWRTVEVNLRGPFLCVRLRRTARHDRSSEGSDHQRGQLRGHRTRAPPFGLRVR